MLHINEQLFFKIKVGLGRGKNNYAELSSLIHLLIFALEQNYHRIQLFGDS